MSTSTTASTISSPVLTGMREEAQDLLRGLPEDLGGRHVVLDGHRTLAATPSFADEVVRILLVERHADNLHAVAVGRKFGDWLTESAQTHGVADKLDVEV